MNRYYVGMKVAFCDRFSDFLQVTGICSMLREAGYRLGAVLSRYPKRAFHFGIGILVATLICVLMIQTPKLYAQSTHENAKYYTTIEIESGDTLWSIAQEYRTSEYRSLQAYIDEVKQINGLAGDNITTGCYLTVPYYAVEPMG